MRKAFITLFFILIVFITSCELDITSDANGRAYIVTVGIDYQNSMVSDLEGTVDDALEISECLRSIYEAKNTGTIVRRMVQEGPDSDRSSELYPSASNVKRMLGSIDAGPDDILVFFYSGHGDVHRDKYTDVITSSFLACAPDKDEGMESLYTELDMDELFSILDSLECPAVAIIDACYSGGVADNRDETGFLESFSTAITGADLRGTSVIAASQPDELSYVSSVTNEEGKTERHSFLTISVLRELGWVHSSERSVLREADGKIRRVYGYLGSVPGAMTSDELFTAVERRWTVANQTPMISESPAAIRIVPER